MKRMNRVVGLTSLRSLVLLRKGFYCKFVWYTIGLSKDLFLVKLFTSKPSCALDFFIIMFNPLLYLKKESSKEEFILLQLRSGNLPDYQVKNGTLRLGIFSRNNSATLWIAQKALSSKVLIKIGFRFN